MARLSQNQLELEFREPFWVGQWLVQPNEGIMDGPTRSEYLTRQQVAVIRVLASGSGRTVTKEELLDQVWGDTAVHESGIARNIAELRRKFGDSARKPRFIRTVPCRGYRLIAPLRRSRRPLVRLISDAARGVLQAWHPAQKSDP